MKTILKKHITLPTVFLIFACSSVFAQQSDYQIQQDFRTELTQLTERVETASSTEELDELEQEIDELEQQFSEHSGLINSAIYPETFSSSVANLRVLHSTAHENFETIGQLNEQIEELSAEMDVFRNRLSEMDREQTALQQEIERAESSERQQAALIRQYRQNIEQRDNFVSDFLQELLSKYQTMDAADQQEIADAAERLDENPLDVIRTILAEYINMADQAPGLETPDYVAMRAQHGYFDDVWDNIGEQLATTFSPDNPVEAQQEITDMLATWLASVDSKMWGSINTAFSQNGISLPSFSSPSDFNSALNTFVDEAYQISLDSNNESDYEVFRNFRDFWNNTVKASWGESLIAGKILTPGQMAAIDVKLNDWGEASSPESNLMFILFLVSLAVIIGLIILLVTRK